MSAHLNSQERKIVEGRKEVGKWIGFAVGFAVAIAFMYFLLPAGLALLGTALTTVTGALVGGAQSGAIAAGFADFMGLIGKFLAPILVGSIGGAIGANVGAHKAEARAISDIQTARTKEAAVALAQQQYMDGRGAQPEVVYGQEKSGRSFGDRYLSEPEQNIRGV
jgi:hypothetical protein